MIMITKLKIKKKKKVVNYNSYKIKYGKKEPKNSEKDLNPKKPKMKMIFSLKKK